MEDALINFETAKLAKEKGFNIPTISYYSPKGRSEESEGYMTERLESSNWNNGQGSYPTHAKDVECSAPTQSLLQKWLREVHNIHIKIEISNIGRYYFQIYHFEPKNKSNVLFFISQGISQVKYDIYEESLEIGLQEALKLIK